MSELPQEQNGVLSKHPHEPQIPPTYDHEGRCLICCMNVQIDVLRGELMRERAAAEKRIAELQKELNKANKRNDELFAVVGGGAGTNALCMG